MNFIAWAPVQTNLVTSLGQFIFADSQSSRFPRRFYRVRPDAGPLPPPAILPDGSAGFHSGRFGFNYAGVPGQTAVVESSADLLTWTPLATNLLNIGPEYFLDPSSSNAPMRFYRLRLE